MQTNKKKYLIYIIMIQICTSNTILSLQRRILHVHSRKLKKNRDEGTGQVLILKHKTGSEKSKWSF